MYCGGRGNGVLAEADMAGGPARAEESGAALGWALATSDALLAALRGIKA